MKKLTATLALSSMLMIACGNTDEINQEETIDDTEITNKDNSEESTPEHLEHWNVSLEDAIRGVEAEFKPIQKHEYKDYHLETTYERFTGARVTSIFKNDDPKQTIGFVLPTTKTVKSELLSDISDNIGNQSDMSDKRQFVTKNLSRNDIDYIAFIPFDSDLNFDDFPLTNKEFSDEDFFSNENNVEKFEELAAQNQFIEIYDMVQSYIDNNNVADYDSAHEMLELIRPAYEYKDSFTFNHDEVENQTAVYYEDLNDVSSERMFVPFVPHGDREPVVKIGFTNNNWIFFERIVINYDGEIERITPSFEQIHTDVLDSGGVKEVYTSNPHAVDKLLPNISEADDIKMKFEGESGEITYQLTEQEKEAAKAMSTLRLMIRDLENIKYGYLNY